jgi:hypothetical protein
MEIGCDHIYPYFIYDFIPNYGGSNLTMNDISERTIYSKTML